jgi:hypothetical protein
MQVAMDDGRAFLPRRFQDEKKEKDIRDEFIRRKTDVGFFISGNGRDAPDIDVGDSVSMMIGAENNADAVLPCALYLVPDANMASTV